jgi:hypothetical protein
MSCDTFKQKAVVRTAATDHDVSRRMLPPNLVPEAERR